MNTPTPLLNTLNGADGAEAQFAALKVMIDFKIRTDMRHVGVIGAGQVQARQGQPSTLLTDHG